MSSYFPYSNTSFENYVILDMELSRRSILHFKENHAKAAESVDADELLGELIIKVPIEAQEAVAQGQMFRVSVEFSLEQPHGGIHFVLPDCEGSLAEVSLRRFSSSHL